MFWGSLMNFPQQVIFLHSFEGHWTGTAHIQMGEGPIIKLSGFQKWQLAASGWAMQGEGRWEGENFLLEEAFQVAYDAGSNLINWHVMYSQGPQAYTITGLFNQLGTELPLSRTLNTPNGLLEESGAWTFHSKDHRTLEVQTKLAGVQLAKITAVVRKK